MAVDEIFYNLLFLFIIVQIIFCQPKMNTCPIGMSTEKIIFTWSGADICKICDGDFACSDNNQHWRDGNSTFTNPVPTEKIWTLYGDVFFQFDTCNFVMNNITFKLNGKRFRLWMFKVYRTTNCCS